MSPRTPWWPGCPLVFWLGQPKALPLSVNRALMNSSRTGWVQTLQFHRPLMDGLAPFRSNEIVVLLTLNRALWKVLYAVARPMSECFEERPFFDLNSGFSQCLIINSVF